MSLTLQDIRSFVRGYPDIDSDDLPDAVLDVFVREGFNRIAASERTWDFYQVAYTLVTVDGTQAYSTTSIGDAALADVSALVGTSFVLKPTAHQAAYDAFPIESTADARPRAWSLWSDSLYLWPTPDDLYTIQVYGYREPSDWVAEGAGGAVDLPADMHELVALWALARTYAQQDDLDAASQFRSSFDDQLRSIKKKYLGAGPSGPIIVGGGSRELRPQSVMLPARFPFQ